VVMAGHVRPNRRGGRDRSYLGSRFSGASCGKPKLRGSHDGGDSFVELQGSSCSGGRRGHRNMLERNRLRNEQLQRYLDSPNVMRSETPTGN